MLNNIIYDSLELYEKTKLIKLRNTYNLDNFKLKSIYKKKIKFYNINKLIGGKVLSNTYKMSNINKLTKELTLIDENEYSYKVEKYVLDNIDDSISINIVSLKKETIEENEKGKVCGSLLLNSKLKTATIINLDKNLKCIKLKNGTNKFKYGDIVMQILIDICKKEGIKKIELTDNAFLPCGNEKLNLDIFKTLTQGQPHYRKYGFLFKNKIDENNYIKNEKIFYSKPKIDKNKLILLINNSECNYNTKKYIIEIINKSNEKNILIKNFAFLLTLDLENKEHCKLISDIYYELYDTAGYKPYLTSDYYLYL